MQDRQTSPFHPLGRVTGEARAAASIAHTISLWKIPSIDSALIKQAALGIPPRFLLGRVRSKREPGWGLEPRLPFPSIQMRLPLLGNSLQSLLVLPPPGAAGSGSKGRRETPHLFSRSSLTKLEISVKRPFSYPGSHPPHPGRLTLLAKMNPFLHPHLYSSPEYSKYTPPVLHLHTLSGR